MAGNLARFDGPPKGDDGEWAVSGPVDAARTAPAGARHQDGRQDNPGRRQLSPGSASKPQTTPSQTPCLRAADNRRSPGDKAKASMSNKQPLTALSNRSDVKGEMDKTANGE